MKKSNQLRSIGSVMILMLVGKLLSLLANQVYLSYFGADNEQLNIFSWVLQIPNYLFQSLGTGLSSTVIPLYAALLAQKKMQEASRFGSNIICITSLGMVLLVGLGWAVSPLLPKLTDFSDKAYATKALMIMMPVMFFYAMTNIYQGILQSMDRHMSAALVNLPSGIVILLYIAFFADRFGVTGLLVTVVFGLFLQFAILPLPAHRAGFRFRPVVDFKDENIRTVGRMMLPVVLGASAYQFNMFFNNTMMSAVEPESVTLFNFVQTLILSSVMTLVLAITSVKYPALTVCAAKEDMMGFRKELSGTMGAMIYLLTPIAFGLICLGHPLLSLISLHGKVVPDNIVTEAVFLTMYSLCIVFLGLKEIADRALYSLRITKVSAWIGVVIMAVNIVFGWILSRMTPLGAAGIPLGLLHRRHRGHHLAPVPAEKGDPLLRRRTEGHHRPVHPGLRRDERRRHRRPPLALGPLRLGQRFGPHGPGVRAHGHRHGGLLHPDLFPQGPAHPGLPGPHPEEGSR